MLGCGAGGEFANCVELGTAFPSCAGIERVSGRATNVRTVPLAVCGLCGSEAAVAYRGLRDVRGHAPGVWSWRRCEPCGLMWLDPRPVGDDIGRLYGGYYTHGQGRVARGWPRVREDARLGLLSAVDGYDGLAPSRLLRGLGRAALAVPPLEEMARLGLMGFGGAVKGKLLDVGCGSGRFVALMRRAGWQVWGVEPDPLAAAVASERFDVEVCGASLADAGLQAGTFDAVVVSHVVEHAADPAGLLAGCRRLLRPGGWLALSTPNVESRGHTRFGADWLHLDVPRHLQLFSRRALAALFDIAGFERYSITTAAKSAAATWQSSAAVAGIGLPRPLALARALGFHLAEWREVNRGCDSGEELFAWAQGGALAESLP